VGRRRRHRAPGRHDPPRLRTPGGRPHPGLPDVRSAEADAYRYGDDVPVFFGHYWFTGTPAPAAAHAVCVDYSAARDGCSLVAYRWDGEAAPTADRFVAFPGSTTPGHGRSADRHRRPPGLVHGHRTRHQGVESGSVEDGEQLPHPCVRCLLGGGLRRPHVRRVGHPVLVAVAVEEEVVVTTVELAGHRGTQAGAGDRLAVHPTPELAQQDRPTERRRHRLVGYRAAR